MKRGIALLAIVVVSILAFVPQTYAQTSTGYHTASGLIADYLEFEEQHPDLVSHEIIGTTVYSNSIYLFKIGNPEGAKVMLQACIHGNEQAASETLYWTVDWLLAQNEEASMNILQYNYVLVIPIVNIDKYGVSRYNAHKVDLNRNFETGWGKFRDSNRGAYALSEPETRAVHNAIATWQPEWFIDMHTGDSRVTPPWSYLNYVPEKAYYDSTYSLIRSLSYSRGVQPLPYRIRGLYGGGTARDEGYSQGAYTFTVEFTTTYKPRYSTITGTLVPKFIPVLITVCQQAGAALN